MSDTKLLLKSKAEGDREPVRRVEVFTGTGRRRRWTTEQKALIVAESYEGGATVSAVARRHGFDCAAVIQLWRRLAQQAQDEGRMTFAPVTVEASRRCGNASIAPSRGSSMIEIAIGSMTVRVPSGTDVRTLHVVLRAVAMTTA